MASSIVTAPKTLRGVQVDATNQPLKAFKWPVNMADDYQRGAFEAYQGFRRISTTKSAAYMAGRRAQLELLPKNERGNVNWRLRLKEGGGWHLGGNW